VLIIFPIIPSMITHFVISKYAGVTIGKGGKNVAGLLK